MASKKKVTKRAKPAPKKKTRKKSAKKTTSKRRTPSRDNKGRFIKRETVQDLSDEEIALVRELRRAKAREKAVKGKTQFQTELIDRIAGQREFNRFKRHVTKEFTLDPYKMREIQRQDLFKQRKRGKKHFREYMQAQDLLLNSLRVIDRNHYGVTLIDKEGKREIYEFADDFDEDAVPDVAELWDMYHEA